jgi:hypothetical protein
VLVVGVAAWRRIAEPPVREEVEDVEDVEEEVEEGGAEV